MKEPTAPLKLRLRCESLAELLPSMQRAWSEQTADTQRDFVETLVGAALWYFPKVDGLWTGFLSAQVLHGCKTGQFIRRAPSEEHLLPRKVAARQLFAIAQTPKDALTVEIERRYRRLYGRYNFVTTSENKTLVQYQRCHLFDRPSTSYKQAGIQFFRASVNELRQARKGNVAVIEQLLATAPVDGAELDELATLPDRSGDFSSPRSGGVQ